MEYYCLESININRTNIIITDGIEVSGMKKSFEESCRVFLHSANYKFSLGSGTSFVIHQMINAEIKINGNSRLQKEIQKIKKTPVGGVVVTNGANLPPFFTVEDKSGISQFPNFHKIVHCVLPGVRVNNFQSRVEQMLAEAIGAVNTIYKDQDKELFFIFPVIGIKNFNYPVQSTLKLYAKLIKYWIETEVVSGVIMVSMPKKYERDFKDLILKE